MTTTESESRTINLAVGGMTCAGCAATIQRGLALLPGVDAAAVNIATRRATVNVDGEMDPAELEDMIRAAITGLGYQVLTPAKGATPEVGAEPMSLADEHAAHTQADATRIADFRRRFIVGAALALPTVLISMIPAWQFAGWEWVVGALATPVVFYSGWPFHRSTVMSARHRATTMDTLVTVGSVTAWTWSMVVLLRGTGHVYFEVAAVIVSLIVLGKWLEVRSTAHAGDAIRALSARQSATARLEDGTVIAREDLGIGMRFVVRPGETIATDGLVVEGEAAIDASLVTGESAPVAVGPGAEVVGGTVAADGALTVEATRVGAETMLAQIARMVDEAQSGRANIQRLADRIAAVFVPVVIVLALVTLVSWLLATGDVDRAFTAAVAVLIISCPCALGLATPLAIMVGVGRGAQMGILIRGPQVLEDTRRLHTVVLDKTGTVTEGRMALVDEFAPGMDADESARLFDAAAAVEDRSEHPIAQAIAQAHPNSLLVKGFRSAPGQGVTATVRGLGLPGAEGGDNAVAEVTVGSQRLFDSIPDELADWARSQEESGATVIFVGRAAPLAGGLLTAAGDGIPTRAPLAAEAAMAVRDTVKGTSREAIDSLKALGLDVVLLTGDNERAARAVAEELGIERVIAEVLPGDKSNVIVELQQGGRRVVMVGDGVNDSPALAQADVGIAIGTGADVAREASDLTLVTGDLRGVAHAIGLARKTLGTIRGNLFWAFAYNVVAIPLAAAGMLNPMIAAAAMGSSSLFVVGNSLRLRRYDARS
ncbi:MAG: heavy metal translocating P-type ATPase [Actinobacteria bacterium HGW-Actinobacteria-8]|nr:MAG: heavy metal translocating P-type ATPase [Actinobacteria bacterium HGW-Actinobacteria-8]